MDRFFASSKGKTTLADKNGPLFSQVIAKALFESPIADAVQDSVLTQHTGQATITNQSLSEFILPRFENLVSQKNGVAKPWIVTDVGYTGNIYRQENPIKPPPEDAELLEADFARNPVLSLGEVLGNYKGMHNLQLSLDVSPSSGTLLFALDRKEMSSILLNNIEPKRIENNSAGEKLNGLHWVSEGLAQRNGTSLLKYQSSSRIVPNFDSYISVVSSGKLDDNGSKLRLEGMKFTLDNDSGLQVFGAALLNGLVSGDSNWRTLEPFADMAWSNLRTDPLAPIALSYYFDALRDKSSVRRMMKLLAKSNQTIPIEVPLFAGRFIRYDIEKRHLKAFGSTLNTQLPILSRGWSKLFAVNSIGIFRELLPLRHSIGTHPYASFENEKDQELITIWLEEHFGAQAGKRESYQYQAM